MTAPRTPSRQKGDRLPNSATLTLRRRRKVACPLSVFFLFPVREEKARMRVGGAGPKLFRWCICLCVFSLLGSACKSADPRNSDTTPPAIQWGLAKSRVIQSGQTVQVHEGQNIQLTLNAEDLDSGISYTSIEGSGQYTCMSGGHTTNVVLDRVAEEQNLLPDQQGRLKTTAVQLTDVTLGTQKCPSGAIFSGGTITYMGKSRNGQGMQNASTIVFRRDR